jgi:hypothetical protein
MIVRGELTMTTVSQADSGKSAEAENSSNISPLLNLIPNVYYDLIARVCPGMLFWLALAAKGDALPKVPPLSESPVVMLVVLIICSYVSGIVFTGFSFFWDWLCFRIFSAIGITEQLGIKQKPFWKEWSRLAKLMDDTEKVNEAAGRVLFKALAEVTLCQNLLSGLIALGVCGILTNGFWVYSPYTYPIPYAAIGMGLLMAMIFREAMFLGRVKILSEINPARTNTGT